MNSEGKVIHSFRRIRVQLCPARGDMALVTGAKGTPQELEEIHIVYAC
jgi:hypothetical protein